MPKLKHIFTGVAAALLVIVSDSLIADMMYETDHLMNSVIGQVVVLRVLAMLFLLFVFYFMTAYYVKGSPGTVVSGKTGETLPEQPAEAGIIPEMLAHQLKTNLTSIIGFSSLLKKDSLIPGTRDMYNNYINNSSNSLLQTYNNLVDLQKLKDRKMIVRKQECHILNLLEEAGKMIDTSDKEPGSAKRVIRITVSASNLDHTLFTDNHMLLTILYNLLENACSFTEDGSIEYGFVRKNRNTLKFFIRDSGSNLNLEQLSEVYKQYSRNSKGLDPNINLASLRMAVARGCIELLGGILWSEESRRNGTSYCFTIPDSKPALPPDLHLKEEKVIPDWSDKIFLVVEDSDTEFKFLETMLSCTRARLVRAASGKEASRHITYEARQGRHFDAAIIDILMPEADGFEVARDIRKCDPGIPLIGQTSYTLENEHDHDILFCFRSFITKPVWYHQLVETLSGVLEEREIKGSPGLSLPLAPGKK